MSTRRITWFPAGVDPLNPDGSEIVLQGDPASPFQEVRGSDGFFAPTWDMAIDITPGVDGGTLRSVRTLVRDPSYRFVCNASDQDVFAAAMQELAGSLNPKRGPGTLQVEVRTGTNAGDVRCLKALYAGGLEGDSLMGRTSSVKWWPFTLKFRALDPLWYSPEPATASWQGKPALPFFAPGVVFQFSEVGVDVVEALDLEGDAPTYPDFTLQGPFLSVRATNSRTGEWWEVSRDTEASEVLTLISKPGAESLTVGSESVWGALSSGSVLFPLSAGDDITWTVNGTSGATLLSVAATPAWNTSP